MTFFVSSGRMMGSSTATQYHRFVLRWGTKLGTVIWLPVHYQRNNERSISIRTADTTLLMERVRSKRWRVISSDESRPRSSLQIYLPPARPAGTGSSSAAACAWARMQIRIETQLPWLASGMVPPIQSAYQSVHASLQDCNARQGSANCLRISALPRGQIALKRNLRLWKKVKRNFREHVRIRAKFLQSGRREDTGGALYRDDGEVGGGRLAFQATT